MIRIWKCLLAVSLALAAIPAAGSSGAQAAEFHCSVSPCRYTLNPDGTGKTTHLVFILAGKDSHGGEVSLSFTCNQLTGTGESSGSTNTAISIGSLTMGSCPWAGREVSVDTTGCSISFRANGTTDLACGTGAIVFTIKGGSQLCTLSIPSQAGIGTVGYHNTGGAKKTELTVEAPITSGFVGVTAGAGCESTLGFTGSATKLEITTENSIITSETTAGTMANLWLE